MSKTCFIVAGPNGAGKTTFAESYLPVEENCYYLINADLIAKGLSPLRPHYARVEAGRMVFRKMEEYAKAGITFAFETTLSGQGYRKRIVSLRNQGYRIVIYYLKLASVELAVERVRGRVLEGGHFIPEEDIRRRFVRSWYNFVEYYRPIADDWIVFDNSGEVPIILEKSL